MQSVKSVGNYLTAVEALRRAGFPKNHIKHCKCTEDKGQVVAIVTTLQLFAETCVLCESVCVCVEANFDTCASYSSKFQVIED